MKHKKEFTFSIICFVIAIVLEGLNYNSILHNPDFFSGLSLAAIIASMSFNIRLIRDFSAPKKISGASRIVLFLCMIYLVVVYAL